VNDFWFRADQVTHSPLRRLLPRWFRSWVCDCYDYSLGLYDDVDSFEVEAAYAEVLDSEQRELA
jgi:hypothetical protein